MVVKYTPLLLPHFWRAAMSHKPEKLRQHLSWKGIASVEIVERYVGIRVVIMMLAVGSARHLKSSTYPSPLLLQSHVQNPDRGN